MLPAVEDDGTAEGAVVASVAVGGAEVCKVGGAELCKVGGAELCIVGGAELCKVAEVLGVKVDEVFDVTSVAADKRGVAPVDNASKVGMDPGGGAATEAAVGVFSKLSVDTTDIVGLDRIGKAIVVAAAEVVNKDVIVV